ncbi:MAG: DNA polymerase I [Oscillospiraceae bacterium]|nr:DNA polymerase I [Oscillospiraceae bacterium]
MKLLAIDGNSIMNRAFYGIKMLSSKSGVYTNAITGFMNIYLSMVSELSPDGIAVAFDMRAPTFRHKAVDSYKANRHGMPDELAAQMPVIKELLSALGVKVLECEGFEADDILGTLSKLCGDSDSECYILTGDRDSLQLIGDNVTVMLHTSKGTVKYDEAKFREDYGFPPIELIDLKALMGDSSDNISGVKGIGEKTASQLIKDYHTIEQLYSALEKGEVDATKSVITKLEAGKADAEQSKWLATIVKDAPIDSSIESYKFGEKDEAKISGLLSGLEMFKLLERLKIAPSAVPVKSAAASSAAAAPEKKEYEIAGELSDDITSLKKAAFLIKDGVMQLLTDNKIYTVTDKEKKLDFLSSDCEKITFGAKPVYHFCIENGRELKNIIADADIIGYVLNTNSSEYTIERMCAEYGAPTYPELGEYGDIAALPGLAEIMLAETEAQGMTWLLKEIELPLTEVLASMEHYGVKVDKAGIKAFGEKLTEEISAIEQQVYFMAGHEFNIGSPKQLGTVLFEEMGLPAGKKTKTGYSTNAEVLENLRDKHPIVDSILQYRQLTKLNSTYVEGLLKVVSEDGRVRSLFKQTETRTGRISSAEPNMQNIPVRTELGRNMRKFFVADDGYVLLDADYSQIELRILSHMSGDKNMQEGFLKGMDIHTATAAQVFDMPADMVTSEMRRAAKAVNFGIVYGIGAFSLSKDIDVSVAEADRYIKNYLARYPGVKDFMDKTVEDAKAAGYAVTMFGRRRPIPELKNSNKNIQAFGKRAAMNAPIQGTAADIIKIAMIKVYRRLREEKLDARLILQVHDELIIEVSEKDAERAAAVLGEEMRNAVSLDIPLTADVSKGKTWYDSKS